RRRGYLPPHHSIEVAHAHFPGGIADLAAACLPPAVRGVVAEGVLDDFTALQVPRAVDRLVLRGGDRRGRQDLEIERRVVQVAGHRLVAFRGEGIAYMEVRPLEDHVPPGRRRAPAGFETPLGAVPALMPTAAELRIKRSDLGRPRQDL